MNKLTVYEEMTQLVDSMPTPSTRTYYKRQLRRARRPGGAAPFPLPIPIPIPQLLGPRVLEWKQDPFVAEIGIRKAFLPAFVQSGPRDARITVSGPLVVSPNAFGDFIQIVGTDEFDCVHTFAVVRQTLTMYQRLLSSPLPWEWNSGGNTEAIEVFPHAGVTMNASSQNPVPLLRRRTSLPAVLSTSSPTKRAMPFWTG
jgi:hypothetical protein